LRPIGAKEIHLSGIIASKSKGTKYAKVGSIPSIWQNPHQNLKKAGYSIYTDERYFIILEAI